MTLQESSHEITEHESIPAFRLGDKECERPCYVVT